MAGVTSRLIGFGIVSSLCLASFGCIANDETCSPEGSAAVLARVQAAVHGPNGVVLASDMLHLQMCATEVSRPAVDAFEDTLQARFVARSCPMPGPRVAVGDDCLAQPIGSALAAHPDLRAWCEGTDTCVVEYFARRPDGERGAAVPFAQMGGLPLATLLGHLGRNGHLEMTRQGVSAFARAAGLSVSTLALDIIASASQDPDFYSWSVPAAHAQAASDPETGVLLEDAEAALANARRWLTARLSEMRGFCTAGAHRAAAYVLGYALHTVQDAVFHEGMSNAEHAWRDMVEATMVDAGHRFDDKFAMGTYATQQYLTRLAASGTDGLDTCLRDLLGAKGPPMRPAERAQARPRFARQMQLTPLEYFRFRKVGVRVAGEYLCVTCAVDHRARVLLARKWIGWDDDAIVEDPEALRRSVTALVGRLLPRADEAHADAR